MARPPGRGKTICAEAIAPSLGRRLLLVRYAELDSLWMNAKGAPATAQTNYALGTENGYDYDFVPGTGHLLQIEQPAECARLVEDFMATCGLRRR